MKAGEEAGRHDLKKPAPMIDPMSWAEMSARALTLLMRFVTRNAAGLGPYSVNVFPCAATAIQRKVQSQTTVWLGGSGALLLSDDGVLEFMQGSWEG